jgi:hypothetical protein
VAIKRWQDFTGKSATLASTHESFAELSAKRTKASAADNAAAQVGG